VSAGLPAGRRWVDERWSLSKLAAEMLTSAGDWSLRCQERWCLVSPAGHKLRRQGWKLHVSATPASAAEVLARTLPVLVSERCAAKFAADLDWVRWLNSPRCPRSMAGKFLTAYPDDDEHFRRVAGALDHATAGLVGPEILSDRRYRPASVVSFRYGGFVHHAVLDDDGGYRPVIVDPAGHLVEDRRDPWFAPPSWAVPVLADPPEVGARVVRGPVLLAGRFAVHRAIRHSARGGVFLGTDRFSGAPVVVKQARAHMELDPSGRDCRDRLRHEAALLTVLAPGGLAPRLVAVVEEGEDLFLVREAVAGETLRWWLATRLPGGGVTLVAGLALARALVWLFDTVHRTGLVLVDVSPNNIMVDSAGVLWLTDLDHAARQGERIHPVGTPGFIAPEHRAGGDGLPASAEADLFGLGGLLFLIATGTAPVLVPDEPPRRRTADRLRGWLAAAGSDAPFASRLAGAVVGLMHERPDARWRPHRVMRVLESDGTAGRPLPRLPRPAELRRKVNQLIGDGLAELLARMAPGGDRLWPASRFGARFDPCAVQHGAAGVLATLVHAAPWYADQDRVRSGVELACRWIEERLLTEPRLLPGLYFGRSGTAWSLYEAAELLGDQRLAAAAVELALRVPVEWPNRDVAHGAAGAGMMLLHLWRAAGDARLLPRLHACADGIVAAARDGDAGVAWPIPATLRSRLAGSTFHGYAHGTAGIAAFLLAAGTETGRAEYLRLAERAAETLVAATFREGAAAFWPPGPVDGAASGRADASWCKGAAGVGTFLLRMGQLGGGRRCLDLARAAGVAVYESRPRATTAHCHGLAGGGHLLLDLADMLGEESYRRWAWDLGQMMASRSARRAGRLLVPDETGQDTAADYGVGLAGAVDFLVRLRHGGPRPWTAEPHDARAAGAGAPAQRPQLPEGPAMTTSEPEATPDPRALQQLPETDPASEDEAESPTCATTGVVAPQDPQAAAAGEKPAEAPDADPAG
jgi:tRNA A-37 threonylcarbamoyl transferase component Bud32